MTTRRTFLKQLGILTALGSLFPRRLLAMIMPKQTQLFRGMEVPGHKVLKPKALAQVGHTREEILDMIIECGRVLDEQDVPTRNRYIQLPETMYEVLTCP
jgi:hypothetical protein